MTKEEVLAKLKFDVELRGFSKHTQDEYYTKAKLFQNHFDKPATELGVEDVRQFLHYLITVNKLAPETVNTYNSGLRFLYGVTLNVVLKLRQLPRHRKPRKLPDILTQEEIHALFNASDNLRDKCILNKTTKLKICKQLTHTSILIKEKASTLQLIQKLTGIDISKCPNCGSKKPKRFMSLGKSPPITIQTASF